MPRLDRAPGVIASYVSGVQYPCSREDLIRYCQEQRCPADTLEALKGLPDVEYKSIRDVLIAGNFGS